MPKANDGPSGQDHFDSVQIDFYLVLHKHWDKLSREDPVQAEIEIESYMAQTPVDPHLFWHIHMQLILCQA